MAVLNFDSFLLSVKNKKKLKEARDLINKKCFDDSLVILNNILDVDSGNLEVLITISKVYLNLKEYDKCLKYLDDALSINPMYFDALYYKGLLLFDIGKYEDSLDYFDKSICTNNSKVLYGILSKVKVLIKLGRKNEAIDIMDYVESNSFKYDGSLWYFKGFNYYNLQMFKDAIYCFRKSIDFGYEVVSSYSCLGDSFVNLKEFDNSLDAYYNALKLNYNSKILYNIGTVLCYLDKYDEAIIKFDESLALVPDDTDVLKNKGQALIKLSKFSNALELFNNSLKLDSNNLDFLKGISICLFYLEDFEGSLKYSNCILNLDSEDFQGLIFKADALKGLKRYDEALVYYDKALSIKKDEDVINEKEELLSLMSCN